MYIKNSIDDSNVFNKDLKCPSKGRPGPWEKIWDDVLEQRQVIFEKLWHLETLQIWPQYHNATNRIKIKINQAGSEKHWRCLKQGYRQTWLPSQVAALTSRKARSKIWDLTKMPEMFVKCILLQCLCQMVGSYVAWCGLSTCSCTSQIMEELSKTFQESVEKDQ